MADATSAQKANLYTTVANLADTERYFGFLGLHGKRLAANEEVSIWGTLQSWLLRHTPDMRAQRSLENALANHVLAIVKTPAVFLWDTTLYVTKVISLANDVLLKVDSSWGEFKSSSAALWPDVD